jgi:multiple sugar transport system permease protein
MKLLRRVILYLIVLVLVFVAVSPLVWLLFGSLKMDKELFANPFALFPENPTFENYRSLFVRVHFGKYFVNSMMVAVVSTIVAVAVAVTAGYSLVRFRFRGAGILSSLLLYAYMIPPILLVLPIYSILIKMGLRDSLGALIIVRTAATIPFCLWLASSYCHGLSIDLEEAAMIDGASRLKAFQSVVIPQLIPAVISLGIQSFIMAWNDLLYSKILIASDAKRTVPLAISTMFGKESLYPWGVILAASVVATVPVLFLFTFGVDKLVAGWGEGSLKG